MRILVVDDERAIRFSLSELLEADGHDVRLAEHAPEALAILEGWPADLVLTDLRMPAMDGLALLGEVRARHPGIVVALVTAHGDERVAVDALKQGAFDYLPKPFDNEEARALVGRAREILALRRENERLREELADRHGPLIGSSAAMRAIYAIIRRAGPTDATVLITGESGTGKELVARSLHAASRRAKQAFVALNCSALPGELVESELFGHAKGSFTGADRDRQGLFEAADGGTVFLDEVGDLAMESQAKLLRALEERRVTRVGETRERDVDVRLLAATNRSLQALERESRFRDDLLYRLRVIQIDVPPLRERREDIIPIAVHFIARLADHHERDIRTLAEDARHVLLAHHWHGNVRELRNALERAVVLADGPEIRATDLPDTVRAETQAPTSGASLAGLAGLDYASARKRARRAFDRAFLGAALERHGGNITRTAEALGMHRQSLQKLLTRAGFRRTDEA
jgi:DNA-binding NtrC family response regulator